VTDLIALCFIDAGYKFYQRKIWLYCRRQNDWIVFCFV